MMLNQTPKINEVVSLWFYSLRSAEDYLHQDQNYSKKKAEILSRIFQMRAKVSKLVKVCCKDGKLFMVSID